MCALYRLSGVLVCAFFIITLDNKVTAAKFVQDTHQSLRTATHNTEGVVEEKKHKRDLFETLFSYLYDIDSYFDDDDYDDEEWIKANKTNDDKYLICRNCTVVINQQPLDGQMPTATSTTSKPVSSVSTPAYTLTTPTTTTTTTVTTTTTAATTASSSDAPVSATTPPPTSASQPTSASTAATNTPMESTGSEVGVTETPIAGADVAAPMA